MYTEDIMLSTKFKYDGQSSTSLDKLQIEMKKNTKIRDRFGGLVFYIRRKKIIEGAFSYE